MQSRLQLKSPAVVDGLHVGIIMDGNGRWATRQGLSRLRGHEAGVEA
ncbi:MAG: undecaprenyl diphosphate synthase family protein, partial [Bradyrhizobium sp.]|nr:undecaprenyl diphosphate synthase family protein [Bradyrhizobium sp.]